jgi:ABC-type antimicrobial peptide transport system permease subunit
MVRSVDDPLALAESVRRAVWAVDPALPIQRLSTLDMLYADSLAVRRFTTVLLGMFAGLAIVLGLVGLYGVMSWGVAEREREIGVRLALGAGRRRVVSSVLAEATGSALAGIAIGLLVATGLRGVVRGLLFELRPLDPITLLAAGSGLLVFCLLASLVPALRATRVEPASSLRSD